MFHYEHVNSTRKLTIAAEIVSLLRKVYKRDAPFRAVFKVKTLAVLFPLYPHETGTAEPGGWGGGDFSPLTFKPKQIVKN